MTFRRAACRISMTPGLRIFFVPLAFVMLAFAVARGAELDLSRLPPHPRLYADAARFAAVARQADPVSQQMRTIIAAETARALAGAPLVYPSSGIRLGVMREVQTRVLFLAFSFRLTGDRRAFERARTELLQLAALPDWGPGHFLGVGEAALASGIGLDWLHAELSADDREAIARAIVANALIPSLKVEEGKGGWVDGDFNWNQVCHGGLTVGALAIAEREPVLAQRIVARAIRNLPKAGAAYAPDGAYPEGPSYWIYGTSFHILMVEALRSALGSTFGLERLPGFLASAEFNNQMVAPSGDDYDFSDYHAEHLNEPIMFWFARELGDRSVARDELAKLARMSAPPSAASSSPPARRMAVSRHQMFGLLWWDPALPASTQPPPRHWTAAGVLPLAVMRSAWDDGRATYLAIKGGTPNHSHGHMDIGSFILEADGVRWALDLGTEDYNKMRAGKLDLWNYTQDSSRWTTFRVGPEGHNLLRFDGARQLIAGRGEIRALPPGNGTLGNVVDLTSLYADRAARVHRTVRLHPDRSVSIEDEWTTLTSATHVTFQWLTRADVTAHADGATLRQNGETLRLRFTSDRPARVEVEDVSAPRNPWDSANPGFRRLVIHLDTPATTTARLRLVATPGTGAP